MIKIEKGINAELKEIKERQQARKATGVPKNVTPEMIYQALIDILENQSRIENKLNEILKQK